MKLELTIGAAGHEELERQIRHWLEVHAEAYRRNSDRAHWRYASSEELVLKAGTAFHGNIWDMTVCDMKERECFNNAFLLTQRNPGFRYVEGWAMLEFGFPCHHAWVIDQAGKVQDPTWKPMYYRQCARDMARGSKQPYHGRCSYIGVMAPSADAHDDWVVATGYPNILSIREDDIEDVLQHGVFAALAGPVELEQRLMA